MQAADAISLFTYSKRHGDFSHEQCANDIMHAIHKPFSP